MHETRLAGKLILGILGSEALSFPRKLSNLTVSVGSLLFRV